MSKTAIQLLIESLESEKTKFDGFKDSFAINKTFDICIENAKTFLEVEKKDLIEAYYQGQLTIINACSEVFPQIKLDEGYKFLKTDKEDAEQYFNQTFKSE